MDLLSLLTVVALLLIAIEMSGRRRNPLVMITGLALLFVSVVLRLLGGSGFFATLTSLFTDVGVSLIVAAVWLRIRRARANPQPFFVLGLLALGAAGLLYLGGHLFGHPHATPHGPTPATSFLLELGPDDQIDEVAPLLDRYGVRYERAFPEISMAADEDLAQVYLVEGDPASFGPLLSALRADAENVDYVDLNRTVRLGPLPEGQGAPGAAREYLENDPLVSRQWGLEAIRGHQAHALLRTLQPTRRARVAIVDTGVDAAHEDLHESFGESPGATDGNGHGTHCAGIAGAVTNNGVGVASLNWEGRFIEVTGYPALDANGIGSLESIAQAILDAADDGADVVSMSLGDVAPIPPKPLVDAVRYALRHGAIVVASAGNSNEDASTHFPSNIDGVIAVAALDEQLRKAAFSNTVGSLSRPLAAPGVNILSSMPGDAYKPLNGTSMATPVVAGLLGVLRALDPALTAEDAYMLLHETGIEVAETDRVGRLVDAEAALKALTAQRAER